MPLSPVSRAPGAFLLRLAVLLSFCKWGNLKDRDQTPHKKTDQKKFRVKFREKSCPDSSHPPRKRGRMEAMFPNVPMFPSHAFH